MRSKDIKSNWSSERSKVMLLPMGLRVDIWHNLPSSNKGCVWSKPSFKKTRRRMLKKSIFISGKVLLSLWNYRPAAMSSSTQLEVAIRHDFIGILNIKLGPFLYPIWPCQDKGVIIWNSSWWAHLILQNSDLDFENPSSPQLDQLLKLIPKYFRKEFLKSGFNKTFMIAPWSGGYWRPKQSHQKFLKLPFHPMKRSH